MHVRPCLALQCFGPFAFFDVKGREDFLESQSSMVNEMEAEMVVSLYTALIQRYPELKMQTSSIAIISPYKAQVLKKLPPCCGKGSVKPSCRIHHALPCFEVSERS